MPAHEIHVTDQHAAQTLEFLLNERDESAWIYRRDSAVRRDVDAAIRWHEGIPYLTPEIVLLYKAKSPRATDDADFGATAPALSPEEGDWLRSAIARSTGRHPWLDSLA